MSLNDKYIINGSTLSDIGDALRNNVIKDSFITSENIYPYYLEKGSGASSSSKVTINADTFGLSNAVKAKFEMISYYSSKTSDHRIYINGTNYFEPQPQILSLPFTVNGATSFSWNSSYQYGGAFKIIPLDADGNVIIPTSELITSKGYILDQTAFVNHTTYTNQSNILVSKIPNIINSIPQLHTVAIRVAKFLPVLDANSKTTSLDLSSYGIKKISQIRRFLGIINIDNNNKYMVYWDLDKDQTTAETSMRISSSDSAAYKYQYVVPKKYAVDLTSEGGPDWESSATDALTFGMVIDEYAPTAYTQRLYIGGNGYPSVGYWAEYGIPLIIQYFQE